VHALLQHAVVERGEWRRQRARDGKFNRGRKFFRD
jgi:hypothetical protein